MVKIIKNIDEAIEAGKAKAKANSKLNEGLSCTWIDLQEQKPPKRKLVLAAGGCRNAYGVGYFDDECDGDDYVEGEGITFSDDGSFQGYGPYRLNDTAFPTHWMPLPEQPEAT